MRELQEDTDDKVSTSQYYIFLYGTDCFFNNKVGANIYHLELDIFSYMALVTSQALHEKEITDRHDDSSLAYLTDSVAVLNGTDKFGLTCHKIIAEAVLLALRAVAGGKPNLYIVGYSRGAVQAALVVQELERIRVELKKSLDPVLSDVFCQSCSQPFNMAMRHLLSKGKYNDQLNHGLLQHIDLMTYSPFLIEPVPGNMPDLPIISKGTWYDPRFSQPMPPLKNHYFLYSGDERARGFRPIVFLEQGSETIKEMPFHMTNGHHATPIGNHSHRFGEDAQSEDIKARDSRFNIIKWDLFLLIDFFDKDTKVFSKKGDTRPQGISDCTEFNKVLWDFCDPNIDNNTIAIDLCIGAMIAEEHTRDFKGTGYGLGVEHQWEQRLLFPSQRPVKYLQQLPHYTLEDRLSALVLDGLIQKREPIEHMRILGNFLSSSEPPKFSRVVEALFYQYLNTILSESDENKFWEMIKLLFGQEVGEPFYKILENAVNVRCQYIQKRLLLVSQSLPQANSQGFWLNLFQTIVPIENVSVEKSLLGLYALYQKASRMHQGIVKLQCVEFGCQLASVEFELLELANQFIQNKFDEISSKDLQKMQKDKEGILVQRLNEIGQEKELQQFRTVLWRLQIQRPDKDICQWQSLIIEYITKIDACIIDKKEIIEQLEQEIQNISVNNEVIIKLSALTDDYHSHLIKTNHHSTNCDDKIAIIDALKRYLSNGQFVEFFDVIRDKKTIAILSKRRDSAFIIFWEGVLDVLMVFVVVVTGFLPLEIYKAMGGHFRFFSTPKGTSYVEEGIQLAQNLTLAN